EQFTLAANAAKNFEAKLLPEHRAEVAALAKAADLPQSQVMLGQCFLDLIPMTACSTIALPAGASPDGVARFGRNLDFPSLGVADKHSTLFVQKPAGKHAFVSIGWPGLIGVLTGMNEHGLTLANMEVSRMPRVPTAMPYMLLYRRVLEECRTVDEAVALLRRTPKQTANNLMLMDAAGDRAVVELTPHSVTVRRAGESQPLVSTNHQRGSKDLDSPGRCSRFDYMRDTGTRQFGTIDERAVEGMLAKVGVRMTLQSMVFEPSARVMHLSTGTSAAKGTFTRVDLKPLFAR
ncbi:MAG TPA: C45 family peptidase, partial [Tepidisphaeraceae bacterium]|nr:C45 family peptidase [Tepidisphaeraceae bacterium]